MLVLKQNDEQEDRKHAVPDSVWRLAQRVKNGFNANPRIGFGFQHPNDVGHSGLEVARVFLRWGLESPSTARRPMELRAVKDRAVHGHFGGLFAPVHAEGCTSGG